MGLGKVLFDTIITNVPRNTLAYDVPSFRLPGFLEKNYGLIDGEKQQNGFMVFEEFFKQEEA